MLFRSNMVVVGLKTEGKGPIIETINGGKTEVLGGSILPVQPFSAEENKQAAFSIVDSEGLDSEGSFSIRFRHYEMPEEMYDILVEETQNGETRQLKSSDSPHEFLTLYSGNQTVGAQSAEIPDNPAPAPEPQPEPNPELDPTPEPEPTPDPEPEPELTPEPEPEPEPTPETEPEPEPEPEPVTILEPEPTTPEPELEPELIAPVTPTPNVPDEATPPVTPVPSNPVTVLDDTAPEPVTSPTPQEPNAQPTMVNLGLNLVRGQTDSVNELLVVPTDDAEGHINGIAPDEAGYSEALLEEAMVVFSTLKLGQLPGLEVSRSLALPNDSLLQFAIIENGSLDSLRRGGAGEIRLAHAFDDRRPVAANALQAPGLQLNLQVEGRDGVTNVVLESLEGTAMMGSHLQGYGSSSELLDFREETGTKTATFEVFRSASYDNLVGFYEIGRASCRERV